MAPYHGADARIVVVELYADLEMRLLRNRGESRLSAKPTKRDLAWSDGNVRALASKLLNSDPRGGRPTAADAFVGQHPHLRVDTHSLTAPETAEFVLRWLVSIS